MAGIVICSGGQTGVDRAALDAALALGIPCGGWCPQGRRAEDGAIPARYPLRELPSCEYRGRTLRNVQDSDATLIISYGQPTGGTKLTREYCEQENKPYLMIDAAEVTLALATNKVRAFLHQYGIVRLNVAGPRASQQPQAYEYTYSVLTKVLA